MADAKAHEAILEQIEKMSVVELSEWRRFACRKGQLHIRCSAG